MADRQGGVTEPCCREMEARMPEESGAPHDQMAGQGCGAVGVRANCGGSHTQRDGAAMQWRNRVLLWNDEGTHAFACHQHTGQRCQLLRSASVDGHLSVAVE